MKKSFIKRMPLSVKMALSMAVVVCVTMVAVQLFEIGRLKNIFLRYQHDMHEWIAQEQLYRFVNLLRDQKDAVKALSMQKNFVDYLELRENSGWTEGDAKTTVYRNSPPEWFPSKAVTRAFYHNTYALLLDPHGKVREVYQDIEKPLSPDLLRPDLFLPRLIDSDGIITYIENEPFQIVIRRVLGPERRLRATLLFAFPIDTEFIRRSQGAILGDYDLALLDKDNRVMASSNPDVIPAGMKGDLLNKGYSVSKKTFFAYGEAEIEVMFVSLMPKATTDLLAKRILDLETRHGLIYAIAFILSSTLVVFLLSGRLRTLTKDTADFVQSRLGIRYDPFLGGDEMVTLEKSFCEMRERIVTYQNNLAEEKERLAVTLASIGDGVIATDTSGTVMLINRVAEKLTGWGRDEAVGEPLEKVFNIINGKTRLKCENPIGKVLREGAIIGLADSTVLISREGAERIISDSGAPIKDMKQNIVGTVLVFSDVTERRKSEGLLMASLEEKEVLLKEIHHRVKNNMQIISSLLDIQSGYIRDGAASALLNESRDRIRTMALIHERLYKSADLGRIDFADYIRDLADYLYHIYVIDPLLIVLDIEASTAPMNINTAVPLALIINELLSNALKHAFPSGEKGNIRVCLSSDDSDRFVLVVADSGIGFPAGGGAAAMDTLGMQLVKTLVGQLKGKIEIDGESGTQVRIEFRQIRRKGE